MRFPNAVNTKVAPSFLFDVAPFFMPAILSAFGILLYQMTGNAGLAPWLIFVGTPIYNRFIMDDETNLTKSAERTFERSAMFFAPLYVTIIWCVVAWIHGLMLFSGNFEGMLFQHKPEGFWESFSYFGGLSFFAVMAQASGHEMVHKKEDIHKMVGGIPYFLCSYSHFGPEHTKGHHKHIATEEDPVSAGKGTTFYEHIFKAVYGSHVSSWNREVERIERMGGNKILSNQMFHFFLMHLCKYVFVYGVFGMGGLYFQCIYTIAGLFWVEAVNYLEHYGLRRDKDADGVYEPVSGFHSWNAPASTISAKIQRHSDHHCIAYRPYQILKHFEDVPHLPFEYFIALLVALCPPVWFHVMDPKADAVMRAKRGQEAKGEEDQWNKRMPMSAADKKRDLIVKAYLATLTVGLTYLTLRQGF